VKRERLMDGIYVHPYLLKKKISGYEENERKKIRRRNSNCN
jgi:hypothetical protein